MDAHALFNFLLAELKGAWRYRWQGLIAMWAIAVIGWLGVSMMPNRYAAYTRVFVDTSTALRPVIEGLAIDAGVGSQLELVRQALFSRPQREKLAQKVGFISPQTTVGERETVLQGLARDIKLGVDSRGPSDSVYTMTYEANDRDTSIAVVKALLDTFMTDVLGEKQAGQQVAQGFLRDQIGDYESRLSAAESQLAQFKKRNVGMIPGSSGDYFSRMQAESDAEDAARDSLRVAMSRKQELESQLRSQPRTSATPNVMGDSETARRLQQAEARARELTLQYTEIHPQVVAINEEIRALRARVQSESALQPDSSDRSAYDNPVYQRIQVALNETNVEIAALQGKIAGHQVAVADFRRKLDQATEVEAELSRLNRDYDVTRSQYTGLVDRLEKSVLGAKADDEGTVKFQVIEPPTADVEPTAPNRPLLLTGVLVISILAGAALAYLLHLLNPVFLNERALGAATGLPVIGVVSYGRFNAWRRNFLRDGLRLAGGLATLFAGYIVVLYGRDQLAEFAGKLIQS